MSSYPRLQDRSTVENKGLRRYWLSLQPVSPGTPMSGFRISNNELCAPRGNAWDLRKQFRLKREHLLSIPALGRTLLSSDTSQSRLNRSRVGSLPWADDAMNETVSFAGNTLAFVPARELLYRRLTRHSAIMQ